MHFRLIIGLLLIVFTTKAQVSQKGRPISEHTSSLARPSYIHMPTPSNVVLEQTRNEPMLAAQLIGVDLNLINHSQSTNIGKYTIYQTKILAEDAKALNIYFNKFKLPKGDQLFLFSPNKKQMLGAFTHENNHKSSLFATDYIVGDELIIEYDHLNSNPLAALNINNIGYFLRETEKTQSSQSCEVNINCEEGNDWQDEKRGVVRLLVRKGSQTFWCSGSLVNNTSTDCAPYILSADHCTNQSTASDYTTSIVYFNFESNSCEGTSTSHANTMTGFDLIANGPYTGGSDFVLLKLTEEIPDDFNPYFNGWKKDEDTFTNGASIHHPSGDIKKISQYTTALTSLTLNSGLTSAYWKVHWVSSVNGHGVTEEGSSGGPLFNADGLIIGTLTAGTSYCSAPTAEDYFGKFSKHWSSNGSTSSKRLMDWLDPSNTGVNELKGTYRPCTNNTTEIPANSFNIWPNPARNLINISFDNPAQTNASIIIYDLLGQIVYTQKLASSNNTSIQITTNILPTGSYWIQLSTPSTTLNQTIIIKR